MATVYKVLGQVNPAANTLTTLYTVPAANSTVVSTITVANLDTNSATFRLAVRPAGEAIANKHYFNYNVSLAGNDTITATLGITLAATDVISVNASSSLVAFSAFGSEIY
jgi:glucose-6-phosphate dehydrogenase assembly protein OpcA